MVRTAVISGFLACFWAGASLAESLQPQPFMSYAESCGMAAQSYAVVRAPDRRSERGRISIFPMSRCTDLPRRRSTTFGSITVYPDVPQRETPDPGFSRRR
jgi:hypothetical protein